jgi:DNA-binding CsgD family transcriptional regulator
MSLTPPPPVVSQRIKVECDKFGLTIRERQTLVLLMGGQTTKAVAGLLGCEQRTIEFHARNLRGKMRAHSMVHAVAILFSFIS